MAFEGRVGHLEGIESPWGNAGGVVKTVDDVEKMAQTGVGWIEAGSYTLEPRPGNAVDPEHPEQGRVLKDYHHDQEKGETFNSLGMPNQGMDKLVEEIPEMVRIAHNHNKPLIINVAPVTEDPVTESLELARRATWAGADAILLNAGCPNVVKEDGAKKELLSRNPKKLEEVIQAIGSTTGHLIMLRTSPYESYYDANRVARMLAYTQTVTAIFSPNTWPDHRPLDHKGEPVLEVTDGFGGKSGPGMFMQANIQASWLSTSLNAARSAVDVVQSSGIMDGKRLRSAQLLGGAVAGAGTTFFYENTNGWQEDTYRLLRDYSDLL